jgi:homocysteine S-methyltransferase
MSPVAVAGIIRQRVGIEAIIHFTCRDRNVMALQSELLGAHALGVRDVIALGGDPPDKGDHPKAKGVFEFKAAGLIALLKGLNAGVNAAGDALEAATEFNIIAAASPDAAELDKELERIDEKIAAGANMLMTQPIFDAGKFGTFMDRLGKKVPVIAGILPLTSQKNALFLNKTFGGITVPPEAVARLEGKEGDAARAEGVKIAVETLEQVRGKASGAYLMPQFGKYEPAAEIIKSLARP